MEVPTINFGELEGEKRVQTMTLLDQACEKWGFFTIENHGIDKDLMEKVKQYINKYYEENLKDKFYKSDIAKTLEAEDIASNTNWESTFFVRHRPESNLNDFEDFSQDFRATMNNYIDQLIQLAEKLAELMSENLGLEKDYIKKAFKGTETSPEIGTKVAKYPECPNPEMVRGLREHTDAGGIILLLQDDQVSGLEFKKEGEWVKIPPSKNNAIFINIGDQVEIVSNGKYKSIMHRVIAHKSGSRLSMATFYNPTSDAVITPCPQLVYPGPYCFKEYLKLYMDAKFGDKVQRFQAMKNWLGNQQG